MVQRVKQRVFFKVQEIKGYKPYVCGMQVNCDFTGTAKYILTYHEIPVETVISQKNWAKRKAVQ